MDTIVTMGLVLRETRYKEAYRKFLMYMVYPVIHPDTGAWCDLGFGAEQPAAEE